MVTRLSRGLPVLKDASVRENKTDKDRGTGEADLCEREKRNGASGNGIFAVHQRPGRPVMELRGIRRGFLFTELIS